jgi:acyl-CoA synthetase (AMP-forming)/AMP-acid ligase II
MQRFSDVTLDQVLALRVAGEDRVAFVERDARLTYHELSHDAGSLAAGLAERGVRRGDRVALLLPAGLDFVRVFWAVQRLGAISCALNPFAPAETIARRVARIRPRLTVTSVDEVPRLGGMASAAPQDPEGIAYLQATSGTSGEPRLAMIRHRNVAAVQRAAIEAMGITANDVLVSWVPPWHDLGLVRFVITPVFTGASCHIVTPSVRTIAEWLATIGRVGGTITGAPDFAYRLAMRLADPRNVDLSTLRFATNGGEPVRQSTIAAFEERFGVRGVVLPGYGLAEATLGVSTIRPGERLRVDERGNVSCGRPMPGVEVRIDVSGEILVRGENVFAGYFDAAEDPRRDGWLHTGDAGRLDEDGHLYVLGRRRAMLKRGGATLAPREVEEAAMHVAGVKIAAAVNVDGEIVVAIESDAVDITSEVARSIHHALGFRPRVMVASIPRTSNGKIRYDALRENLTPALEAALSTDTVP